MASRNRVSLGFPDHRGAEVQVCCPADRPVSEDAGPLLPPPRLSHTKVPLLPSDQIGLQLDARLPADFLPILPRRPDLHCHCKIRQRCGTQ